VRKVDDHRAARATGRRRHAGRLYVVTSGVSEETAASMPDYECCTFRGSLTALDATSGEVVWKTYTVDEPQRRGTSTSGKPLWGPAGAPIWSAPTIDEKRGLIYAATGNAYADPSPRTSDAIVAFEMATGRIRWVNQIMPDVWILGCGARSAAALRRRRKTIRTAPRTSDPTSISCVARARDARERPRRARRDSEVGRRLLARPGAARP
jgi:glucose dehydrogenase